jgi:hypothetical protein
MSENLVLTKIFGPNTVRYIRKTGVLYSSQYQYPTNCLSITRYNDTLILWIINKLLVYIILNFCLSI